jgi:K+-sensing histidine kinase KdpD
MTEPGQLSNFPTATLCFVILYLGVKTSMASEIHHELETGSKVREHESRERGSTLRNFFSLPGAGTLTGGFICFIAALVTGSFASSHSWRAEVPLMFTIVLLLVALIFGAWAGVVGTVLSALVFATHLFGPLGELRVANDAARSNLGWMLMIGIAFSFLFAPEKTASRRQ